MGLEHALSQYVHKLELDEPFFSSFPPGLNEGRIVSLICPRQELINVCLRKPLPLSINFALSPSINLAPHATAPAG